MKRICISFFSFIMIIVILLFPGLVHVSSSEANIDHTEILIEPSDIIETIIPTETLVVELPRLEDYIEEHCYKKLESKDDILQCIETQQNYIDKLYSEIYFILVDGGIIENEALKLIKQEEDKIKENIIAYQNDYNTIVEQEKWAQRWNEYPVATEVWLFMKNELNWSDEVAAGAMGNMMHECGGCTLNLNWVPTPGDASVGICQWKICFEDRAWLIHSNLQDQLNFLKSNVEIQIDNWGWKHKEGFNYNAFCNLTSCEEAAEAFATCYERCTYSEKRYETRRNLAQVALQYFTS